MHIYLRFSEQAEAQGFGKHQTARATAGVHRETLRRRRPLLSRVRTYSQLSAAADSAPGLDQTQTSFPRATTQTLRRSQRQKSGEFLTTRFYLFFNVATQFLPYLVK